MLLRPSHLTFPASPEQLFGRSGPVVVEVGIGNGLFIADLAASYPSWNVLGLELSPSSVTRAFRLLRRQQASNARLFLGHARFFLRNVAAPGSLDRVYVNFPDPWPRPKHAHKRLLTADFFRLLSTRFAPGGALLLTTDHEGYFHFAREQAAESGLYREEEGPPPPETLRTKYAQKWEARDRTFFHAAFYKTGEAPGFEPDVTRCDDMHHAVLQGSLPVPEAFEKQVYPFRGGHVVLREVYRALTGDALVFLVHIEEPDLTQEVIVEARPSKNGVFVGLKRFGEPLYTRGVNQAVHAATTWLVERGMEVVHQRY